MTVFDAVTKEPFEEKDITSRIGELRRRSLVDRDGCAVIAVNHATKPHFRRLVSGDELLGGREQQDRDSHDNCKAWLLGLLKVATRLKVVTYNFNEDAAGDGGEDERFTRPVLAEVGQGIRYDWFDEARIGVDLERYIQPDLAGRHAGTFAARPSQPSIVIEVVRTHTPEPETLAELLKLSCTGHLVVFYFVGKQRRDSRGALIEYQSSKYNSVRGADELELRVSYYLYGGEGFRSGKVFGRRANESPEAYVAYLSDLLNGATKRV
ncbi:hypothetical protein [Luteibacter aegosomatissinici]|uniref:hypothetical protein n=1 Tax=Luteibacter aegosomatissinici TaxID=2911539 RepID=UPI001FFB0162|nr:hypothetical protein [Luteibacter aegosomatissinici]UPG92847.1 hypothetical protein L2Y97_13330 [Luteibacter aegosomatissinici]